MAEAVAAPVANMVKKDSTMLIVLGVVTVILGVLAMMAPMIAGAMVTLMLGIKLIFAGWAMAGIGAAARGSARDVEDAVEVARDGA